MLAAWGIYTEKDGEHIPLPDPNSTKQNKMGYSSPGWIAVFNEAMDNRNDAEGWLAGDDSKAVQVDFRAVSTVPVVKRGPYRSLDDLKGLGFPIVLVDYWVEITPDSLDAWWREMSPGLRGFRDRCLTSDGFWWLMTT